MLILKIVGWVFVTYLIISTIYSITTHLGSYFRAKGNDDVLAEDLEFYGQKALIPKKEFLQKLIEMQIVKILISGFLIYLLIR